MQLAVTPGEPAGIGPDLLIQLVQTPQTCELVAFADPELLRQRAAALNLPLRLRAASNKPLAAGELAIAPISLIEPCQPQQLNPANSAYVLTCLEQAASACQTQQLQGMVTGPVNKAVINDAGIAFTGHTEFLAKLTHTHPVVMLLATPQLKVALATTHLPLREVADALSIDQLITTINIIHKDFKQKFGLASPRILVCGLNPHAGESGHMGREEIDIISPAIEDAQRRGIDAKGPYPADTVFTPSHLAQGDVVLAMYHDQGLPVLKHQGFGEAVNVSLGLPIIRTSVDHGTALDLAGTGQGDTGSLRSAIAFAATMATASLTSLVR